MAVAMWFALVAGCQFYAWWSGLALPESPRYMTGFVSNPRPVTPSGFAPTFKVFVRERQP